MQTALATILLSGSLDTSVTKRITPAEAVILKAIHASDCIESIKVDDKPEGTAKNRTSAAEIERLARIYGSKVVSKAFPGAMPKLPDNFVEVGVVAPEPDIKPVESKKGSKPAVGGDITEVK